MTPAAIADSQRRAAKVVGLSYLLFLPPALLAGLYAFGQLIVHNDAAATARNLLAHEQLFRLGIAGNLISLVVNVALIAALHAVLEPVHRNLARFAVLLRLIETALLVVVTVNFDALRALSSAEYLRVFSPDQRQALGTLAIGAYNTGYDVSLVFAGLGSTVFCYLWWRSGYIPKPLALWGLVASLVLATCTFAFLIVPDLARVVTMGYYGGPIFGFELTMGFWLLIKGLRRGPPAAAPR